MSWMKIILIIPHATFFGVIDRFEKHDVLLLFHITILISIR